MVMGLGAMKGQSDLRKATCRVKIDIPSLTRAKDADQPLAVDLRQWICSAAMIIDQRLTKAIFWTNIKFHRFCLFGDGTTNCFRQ
jgi:hypothetical protein